MAGINQIVAGDHVGCAPAGVLAGQLNTVVHIVHDVSFNQNSCPAIHIDTVRIRVIGKIASRCNVVYRVFTHHSIACPINRGILCDVLKANHVDADIVVVVYNVFRDLETGHVPIHDQRFT